MSTRRTIYRPVNWVNGMNINRDHFVKEQQSNLYSDMAVSRNSITPYNYGLNVDGNSQDNFLWIDISDNLQVTVTLQNLSLLFANGYLLRIDDTQNGLGQYDAVLGDLKEAVGAYVVIGVDVHHPVAFGDPDADELPVRKPDALPSVNVSVVSEQSFHELAVEDDFLILGKLYKDGETWMVDDAYLPPIQRIDGHADLKMIYKEYLSYYHALERSCVEIITKIRVKNQDNELAQILYEISSDLKGSLNQALSQKQLFGTSQAPIYLFESFVEIARTLHNTLETWTGCGKDELLTYLAEWCNVTEGEFEHMLKEVMLLKYNHNAISESVILVTSFAKMISSMFTILAGLDFIGKKLETDLFIAEENSGGYKEDNSHGTTKRKGKFGF